MSIKPLVCTLLVGAMIATVVIVWQIYCQSQKVPENHESQWIIYGDEHMIKSSDEHFVIQSDKLKIFGWRSVAINVDVAQIVRYAPNETFTLETRNYSWLNDEQIELIQSIVTNLENQVRLYFDHSKHKNTWNNFAHPGVKFLGAQQHSKLRFLLISGADTISWGFPFLVEEQCTTSSLLIYDQKNWLFNQLTRPCNWRRVFVDEDMITIEMATGFLLQAPIEFMSIGDREFIDPMISEAQNKINSYELSYALKKTFQIENIESI